MAWWKRKSRPSLSVGVSSHVGQVRTNNEDAYGVFEGAGDEKLFIVADGMGGHQAGEVASRLAVEAVQQTLFAQRDQPIDHRLQEAFGAANEQVYAQANGEAHRRMGTTCTVLALVDGEGHIGHAGDSRAYRIEADEITQLTRDHTVATDMLDAGILTNAEAAVHPRRHALTRAIGVETDLEVDVISPLPLTPHTRYLLCSDGLLQVPVAELQDVALLLPPQEACNELVRRANAQGGTDNITVLIIAFEQ